MDENENVCRHLRFPVEKSCRLWCFHSISPNALVCWHVFNVEMWMSSRVLLGLNNKAEIRKSVNQWRAKAAENSAFLGFSGVFLFYCCCCCCCTIWLQPWTQSQRHRKLCDSCLSPCCWASARLLPDYNLRMVIRENRCYQTLASSQLKINK